MIGLFPLQTSIDNFALDSSVDPVSLIIGGSVLAAFIIVIVIINAKKGTGVSRKQGGGGSSPQPASSGILSGFKLRSLARNIGLNSEQTKMLDYVFRMDMVTDPEKSISTPALLDRHFRKTYRVLEQSTPQKEAQHKLVVLFSTRNMLENSVIGGISSTRQLKEDSTLVITSGKDKLNVNVISPKGDYLLVETPRNVLGSQIKIARGTRLTVMYFNKSNKGFSFETRVVGYISHNGHHSMQLAHSNQMRFLSQRRYRRRQGSIACFMNLVYVEGSGKKQRLIVDKRKLGGNIADISVGGCSIKIMAPVQVGARFKIEFPLGDVNVAALGQVLRSNRTGMSTIVHIRFLRVSVRSMNIINAYVYEYGRE
ncbi:MAG: PilZ domain-containing protein [Treponema sp.]|nr:PilZ domain-containing protein [Treponema sp.]